MAKRLYVGNLPYSITDESLKNLFSKYGEVTEAEVVKNKFNGRSKGFGFVSIDSDSEADKAINEMNGKEIEGRAVVVTEAKPFDPNKPRPKRSFGGSGGRSFGGRSFGGRNSGRSFGNRDSGGRSFGRRYERDKGESYEGTDQGDEGSSIDEGY